jgi:hypothetical protein
LVTARQNDDPAHVRKQILRHTLICSDPEVMRFLGEGRPLDRWEAWRSMAAILGHWQLRGSGPWVEGARWNTSAGSASFIPKAGGF